ncbi:MAG: SDR family NAD(P)-dependent oxidoreductase [Janthinobacterium lividum]
MSDKVLLITGAGGGIGRAAALNASHEGALLALSDLNRNSAEATADMVRAAGGTALAVAADVCDAASVAALLHAVVARYGRLDCALNNAGIAQWHAGAAGLRVGEMSEAAWTQVINTNLNGTWLCMKAELEQMQRNDGGSIVNTASISGLIGMPRSGAYVASKHAIIGLTKSAALEYARDNIRINCVCPGFVDTQFVQAAMADRGPQIMSSVPMGRLGSPEEISEMIVWLLSQRAGYVTGGAFPIDGGVMAG